MTDAPTAPPAKDATAVRTRLVHTLRRDLIGPGPEDANLARELLTENPSRWYLTGFVAPSLDAEAEEEVEDEGDPAVGDDEGADPETGRARAADDTLSDEPSRRPRRFPPPWASPCCSTPRSRRSTSSSVGATTRPSRRCRKRS